LIEKNLSCQSSSNHSVQSSSLSSLYPNKNITDSQASILSEIESRLSIDKHFTPIGAASVTSFDTSSLDISSLGIREKDNLTLKQPAAVQRENTDLFKSIVDKTEERRVPDKTRKKLGSSESFRSIASDEYKAIRNLSDNEFVNLSQSVLLKDQIKEEKLSIEVESREIERNDIIIDIPQNEVGTLFEQDQEDSIPSIPKTTEISKKQELENSQRKFNHEIHSVIPAVTKRTRILFRSASKQTGSLKNSIVQRTRSDVNLVVRRASKLKKTAKLRFENMKVKPQNIVSETEIFKSDTSQSPPNMNEGPNDHPQRLQIIPENGSGEITSFLELKTKLSEEHEKSFESQQKHEGSTKFSSLSSGKFSELSSMSISEYSKSEASNISSFLSKKSAKMAAEASAINVLGIGIGVSSVSSKYRYPERRLSPQNSVFSTFSKLTQKSERAPKGVPTLKEWTKNKNGTVTGHIFGSPAFQDDDKVTTSRIATGKFESGKVVETSRGSKYFLA